MATLPVYDVGGTQRVQQQQSERVNDDMFGAAQGRALQQVGGVMQQAGDRFLAISDEERQRDEAANVMNSITDAQKTMRSEMYGPGGLMERTGTNANNVTMDAQGRLDALKQEQIDRLKSPGEREAFSRAWAQLEEGMLNATTKHEFGQRQAVRTMAKTAGLENLTDDVITNFNNPEMLAKDFDLARKMIRANPDGLPPEAVTQLERESVSALHLQVIQRMATDDPGAALDYYEKNKKQVNGTDHADAQKIIGQVSNIREVRSTVDEIIGNGPAGDVVRSVIGAESSGDPSAVSPVGAAGLMQLMPETARETARGLGLQHVAEMNDAELQEYWQTPAGKLANVRVGTAYLGKQIQRFKGDLEAALVAYNAGPENAVHWLNEGRDYSILPKPEETLPYVRKVLTSYRGVNVSGETSADIQASINGTRKTYFNGDSRAFLKTKLQSQHGDAAVDGMGVDLSDRLAAMMNDAPDFVKQGLDILSGFRSVERQRELWEASDKSGKWVARPGGSQHNHGNAADLGWQGQKFAAAPKEVREWVHANAASYGLTFPLGHEPWHIETNEARAKKGARPTREDAIQARIERAHSATTTVDVGGFVTVPVAAANPADLYTRTISPFTVDTNSGTLEGALSQAREMYAENPVKLAEAERQITEEIQMRNAGQKQAIEDLQKKALRAIMGGADVRTLDPALLTEMGPEKVNQLLTIEKKFRPGGDDTTDDKTYIDLVQMPPEQFKSVNLVDYSDRLSGADLREFARKQAELMQPNGAALNASTQTRTQIVGNAQQMLGLKPEKTPDDAASLAMLNRALDGRIASHVATTGKEPNGIEIQKMVDELLIEGRVEGTGWLRDTRARAFELTPEQRSSFVTAETLADVPPEAQPVIAKNFRTIYGFNPNEETAVDFYNDTVRVSLGGAPTPPPDLETKIRQGLARKNGRPPTPDEVAQFYRNWIIEAQKAQQ